MCPAQAGYAWFTPCGSWRASSIFLVQLQLGGAGPKSRRIDSLASLVTLPIPPVVQRVGKAVPAGSDCLCLGARYPRRKEWHKSAGARNQARSDPSKDSPMTGYRPMSSETLD
jgi:hypothetical protein